MRRRLDQLIETNKRYGHPFALVVFDVEGPGTRESGDGDRETISPWSGPRCATASGWSTRPSGSRRTRSASSRPTRTTVEGVQMTERLLRMLDELEAAGGLRIAVSAGVVACPEHGEDAESCCTGPTRRCGEPAPSASRWASVPCKIADRSVSS